MAEERKRIYFITPSFRIVGGVVKIFDYVNHARTLGYEVVICCQRPWEKNLALFEHERFADITPRHGIRFMHPSKIGLGPEDLVFFSWPQDYQFIEAKLNKWLKHEQVIHIVQGVRHANPTFAHGYALRLLTRPMARIVTNDVLLDAVEPYLNKRSLTRVIPLGHHAKFFLKRREGGWGRRIKVAYTTWKSDLGDRVAQGLAGEAQRFQFRAIRDYVTWKELKTLYQWSDVFLATPRAEEGFYLPGLEAMAAGSLVISPDATGNRAYCDFGTNCLYAELEDEGSYVEVLKGLGGEDSRRIVEIRDAGYQTVERHSLTEEGVRFSVFLDDLWLRLRRTESLRKELRIAAQ